MKGHSNEGTEAAISTPKKVDSVKEDVIIKWFWIFDAIPLKGSAEEKEEVFRQWFAKKRGESEILRLLEKQFEKKWAREAETRMRRSPGA